MKAKTVSIEPEEAILRSISVTILSDKQKPPKVELTGEWKGGHIDTLFSIIVKAYKHYNLNRRREGQDGSE